MSKFTNLKPGDQILVKARILSVGATRNGDGARQYTILADGARRASSCLSTEIVSLVVPPQPEDVTLVIDNDWSRWHYSPADNLWSMDESDDDSAHNWNEDTQGPFIPTTATWDELYTRCGPLKVYKEIEL